jgi:hypothetical protein
MTDRRVSLPGVLVILATLLGCTLLSIHLYEWWQRAARR